MTPSISALVGGAGSEVALLHGLFVLPQRVLENTINGCTLKHIQWQCVPSEQRGYEVSLIENVRIYALDAKLEHVEGQCFH